MKKSMLALSIILFCTNIYSQNNSKDPNETMSLLIQLFQSYHKAEKDQKLTPAQKKENEITGAKIGEIFHFSSLIEGALKDHWKDMTNAQKTDFFNKFKKLIEVIAFPHGKYFYTHTERTFDKAVIEGNIARIHSINYNFDKDLEIDMSYIFQFVNNKWVIIDLTVNDHSLVDAYRLQINRIVNKKGLSGLMEVLNKKYYEAVEENE